MHSFESSMEVRKAPLPWCPKLKSSITFLSTDICRFQLMCYKHMWDKSVGENFPTKQFLDYYNLNPHRILSEDIRENAADAGLPAEVESPLTSISYFQFTESLS